MSETKRQSQYEQLESRLALSGNGLLGVYFDDINLTQVADQRIDPIIQFPAGFNGSPIDIGDAPAGTAVQPDDQWSIRWTGFVFIDTPGEWTFHTDSDDGVRLWVDDQLIINEWTRHALQRDSGTLELGAGWYPIRLEYFQDDPTGGLAAIQLLFEGPGQVEEVIPTDHLSSQLFTGQDIGGVAAAGSTSFDSETGTYTVAGSGRDIFGMEDEFHFASIPWSGDGEIIARVTGLTNTHPSAKAGLSFRESLDPDAANAIVEIKATTGSEFQYRNTTGGNTSFVGTVNINAPHFLRLVRQGDMFTGFRSIDGSNWIFEGSVTIPLAQDIFVGLSVTSHNDGVINTATFDNVSLRRDITGGDIPQGPSIAGTGATGFIPLLTPQTFDPLRPDETSGNANTFFQDEFYTYRNSNGSNPGFNEDQGRSPADDVVFRLTDEGYLHILGIPDNGQSEAFGYLSTEDSFRNYHLTLEYLLGNERFAPRQNAPRDSGLLYHVIDPDDPLTSTWPDSVETQIQEGDTGDFFFLWSGQDRARGTVARAPGTNVYQAGGEERLDDFRVIKSQTVDSPDDWNRVEVIVENDNVTVIVNGVVVNRAIDLNRGIGEDGLLIPLTEGRIQLQAEGAEIFYRNIEIKPVSAVGGYGDYRVLVFQETAGFTHNSIGAGAAAISQLGQANGFAVDIANDSTGVFTEANLSQYDAVIWNNTSGDVLNETEQAAFESYIQNGGGFVGIHAAADTENDWQFYGDLVGAYFVNHPAQQFATINLDPEASIGGGGPLLSHPAADSLPQEWTKFDEWYNFDRNPRENVNVLLTLDESTYNVGNDPDPSSDHPIAWWHDYEGGRSFYTGLGDRTENYTEPLFLAHLLGGIEYAAGVSRVAPEESTVLFDGTSTAAFENVSGGASPAWQLDDEGNLEVALDTGDIQTTQEFTDYRLHLEFKTPATSPSNPEQNQGNSGLVLGGSYELQILDSYGINEASFGDNDLGAFEGLQSALANAALPAETWQVFDLDFTAAEFDASGNKIANARVTAYLNGVLIHDNVELTSNTPGAGVEEPGPQPIVLRGQSTNADPGIVEEAVKFRNIWVVPTNIVATLPGDYDGDGTVAGDDLTVFLGEYGANTSQAADGDLDNDVDGADFLLWQRNFGASNVSSSVQSSQAAATAAAQLPVEETPSNTTNLPASVAAGLTLSSAVESSPLAQLEVEYFTEGNQGEFITPVVHEAVFAADAEPTAVESLEDVAEQPEELSASLDRFFDEFGSSLL